MLRDITKNMKSLLQILLVLLIGFSIVACSTKQDVEEDDDWLEIVTSDGSVSTTQDGATFRITASKDEDGKSKTIVEVYEGKVETEINKTEEKVTVTNGKSIEISEGQVKESDIKDNNSSKGEREELS